MGIITSLASDNSQIWDEDQNRKCRSQGKELMENEGITTRVCERKAQEQNKLSPWLSPYILVSRKPFLIWYWITSESSDWVFIIHSPHRQRASYNQFYVLESVRVWDCTREWRIVRPCGCNRRQLQQWGRVGTDVFCVSTCVCGMVLFAHVYVVMWV